MVKLGVKYFLLKIFDTNDLSIVINEILQGKIYFSNTFSRKIITYFGKPISNNNVKSLSEREIDVMKLVCSGSNDEIAEK